MCGTAVARNATMELCGLSGETTIKLRAQPARASSSTKLGGIAPTSRDLPNTTPRQTRCELYMTVEKVVHVHLRDRRGTEEGHLRD